MSPALLVYVIVVLCSQHAISMSENLIEDGSFEEYPSTSWNVTERISTWLMRPSPSCHRDGISRRSGHSSAIFGGPFNDIEAVFMSQYINVVDRLGAASAGAVRLEFWTSGRKSPQLRAQLDIAYADHCRRMSAVISPSEQQDYAASDTLEEDFYLDNVFMRSCIIVPNYGRIRAMMLHFVVDNKLVKDDFINVDDVDLQLVSPDEAALEDCPLSTVLRYISCISSSDCGFSASSS